MIFFVVWFSDPWSVRETHNRSVTFLGFTISESGYTNNVIRETQHKKEFVCCSALNLLTYSFHPFALVYSQLKPSFFLPLSPPTLLCHFSQPSIYFPLSIPLQRIFPYHSKYANLSFMRLAVCFFQIIGLISQSATSPIINQLTLSDQSGSNHCFFSTAHTSHSSNPIRFKIIFSFRSTCTFSHSLS